MMPSIRYSESVITQLLVFSHKRYIECYAAVNGSSSKVKMCTKISYPTGVGCFVFLFHYIEFLGGKSPKMLKVTGVAPLI